jgi:hypothetical protein
VPRSFAFWRRAGVGYAGAPDGFDNVSTTKPDITRGIAINASREAPLCRSAEYFVFIGDEESVLMLVSLLP